MHERFERHLKTSDGVDFAWLDYGPAHGRAMVLCHGLGAGADQFDADARAFAGQGFRVLVPDLRGHGRSGKPDPQDPLGFTIPRMARDLLEMFDAAGVEKLDYVGNSLGGILALHLVKDHPQRFRTLTTFGTALALNLPRFAAATIPWTYRLMGKGLTARLTALSTTSNPEARPVVERLLRAFDPEIGKKVTKEIAQYDLVPNALGFPGPYMLIRGEKDSQINATLRKTLPRIENRPGFQLIELPGAGHCANLDKPEAFRTILTDFLSQHPAGA